MNIRPSYKRLHYEDWRDWQKEAYMGIHTGFVPADPADVYQYPRHCPELNRIPVPQWSVDYTDQAELDRITQRSQIQPTLPPVVSPQVQLRMTGTGPQLMRPLCIDRLMWFVEKIKKKSPRPRGGGQGLKLEDNLL